MTRRSPFDPLKDAAKYVRAFRNKPFVVKIGGDILADGALRKSICGQLALLSSFGIPLVVVHGGGPAVDRLCQHLGLATQKIAGRRVTTPEVLEVAKMILKGAVQLELIADLQAAGEMRRTVAGSVLRRRVSLLRRPFHPDHEFGVCRDATAGQRDRDRGHDLDRLLHLLVQAAGRPENARPHLALQLSFCFEVSALSGSLVSPSPE